MAGGLDMTTGTGWKHVARFSLPLMLGNLLQQLYNTVDGIVVGQFVSDAALAAVGNCASLTFVFLAISFGLANGTGIAISQLFGAKRTDEMRRCASTALILLISVGAAVSVIGALLSPWLLRVLMKVPEGEVLKLGISYFTIYAGGLIFQFAYNAVAAVLRAVGDSKATLYFLCVTAVLNAILDLTFVIVFHWGVAGTAVATVLAQAICTVFSVIYMYRHYAVFRYKRGEFVFDREKGAVCLKLGIPTMLQQSVVAFGGVFMQRLVNYFSQDLMAAFTVGNRVENYIFVPIMALNNGMSTFTGQNLGARKPERVRECWKRIELLSLAITLFVAALAYIFAPPIARLFGIGGVSLGMAVEMIRFMSFFFCMFSLYLPTMGLLQGAGDALYSMLCSFSTLGARVASAYIMVFAFGVGYQAVWYAVPVGWTLCIIMGAARYFSGVWEKKSIVKYQPSEVDINVQ
jgi:putative MATE family efflux protein